MISRVREPSTFVTAYLDGVAVGTGRVAATRLYARTGFELLYTYRIVPADLRMPVDSC